MEDVVVVELLLDDDVGDLFLELFYVEGMTYLIEFEEHLDGNTVLGFENLNSEFGE